MSVTSDAQFALARTLKPLVGFEEYYQGESAVQLVDGTRSVPVPFFDSAKFHPQYTGRDERAGEAGFDPDLLDFVPVPAGSLIKLWLPMLLNPSDGAATQAYRYQLEWRLADLGDYADGRPGQYHLGQRSNGAPDDTIAPAATRILIPAATRSNIVNQAETTDPFFGQLGNVRREYLVVRAGDIPARPLIPQAPGSVVGVRGVYQQGLLSPTTYPEIALEPQYVEVELVTGGDRMLITADRFGVDGEPVEESSDWDFAADGLDHGFSFFYGTGDGAHEALNNVGIKVFTGTGGS